MITTTKPLTLKRNESLHSSPQINLLMKTIIAIFLVLKAVSNGIKLPQRGSKTKDEFIGHILAQSIMLVVHLWFGLWMLIKL